MNEFKLTLTKESWAALTDEEKTIELQQLIPGADYKKYKEDYERMKEFKPDWADYGSYEHPVICLELIDPVMTDLIMAWMYQQGEKLDQIPVFGYKMNQLYFDKASLFNFDDNERAIIKEAIEILKSKVGNGD